METTFKGLPGEMSGQASESRFEAVLARIKDKRVAMIVQMAFATLDRNALASLQTEIDTADAASPLKTGMRLADLPRQIVLAAPVIVSLDLDHASSLRILGVARASASVLLCAKSLSHEVVAAAPSNPVSDRLLSLMRIPQYVPKKAGDMPDGNFDLIITGNLTLADAPAWDKFLAPLLDKLNKGGRIVVLLVRSAVTERGFDPERVMDMFERSGAQIVRANSMMIINKEMPVGTAASFVADTQIPTDTNADNMGVKKKPFWKFW